jgi:hypothetical protein
MKSVAKIAVLVSGLALSACGAETGPAMSGTDPGQNAPNIQRAAAAATAAQPGTSTGVTEVNPGTNQGGRTRPSARRSASQAQGNLQAPASSRPVDPYQGGRGSN